MRKLLLAALSASACSLVLAAPAVAAPFTVDDLSDVSDETINGTCDATGADTCTLRAALQEANAATDADTISVSLAGTINVTLGVLVITEDTTVTGNVGGTTLDAGGVGRVISASGPSVTLNDLTIQDGASSGGDGAGIFHNATTMTLNRVTVTGNTMTSVGGEGGGGIATSGSGGSLFLNESTVSGNTVAGTSGLGGGILARGPLSVVRSTVSGNTTTLDGGGRGGGIDMAPSVPSTALTISNSTISGNGSGGGGGGGLFVNSLAAPTIVGSTIAGNTSTGAGAGVSVSSITPAVSENTIYASNTGTGSTCFFLNPAVAENNIDTTSDCVFGTGSGNQENVSGAALGLGALASNGGPTQTRAISPLSVAIDAASGDCGALTVDQLGTTRPQGDGCDVGAFEVVNHTLTVSVAGSGSGTVTGTGVSCPGDCSTTRPTSIQVDLTATPAPGSSFSGWSGDCSGTGDCTVTLDADRAATATFTANPPPPPPGGGTPTGPKKCKKGQKLKKGKCVKKKGKRKR